MKSAAVQADFLKSGDFSYGFYNSLLIYHLPRHDLPQRLLPQQPPQ